MKKYNDEIVEYTRENYPSFGKKYNGENAVISLTSWKARINTVSKTLFSLIQQCPGFHIVLVLSEEEFPQKEAELPDNLMLFVENDLIEILWVYKNYKSFKKVLFTMDKYRGVPVISADDDCIYTCNYAQELYDKWIKVNDEGIYYMNNCKGTGYGALFSPKAFDVKFAIKNLLEEILKTDNDDVFYLTLHNVFKTKSIVLNKKSCIFHDDIEALTQFRTTEKNKAAIRLCEKLIII